MALVVAVEGLPGSGKTTVIQMLANALRDQEFIVEIVDIETTGHAPALRPITRTYPLGHPARVLLFWVLRLQQYDEILRTMARADIIFADRFWGSTLAYDVLATVCRAISWIRSGNISSTNPTSPFFLKPRSRWSDKERRQRPWATQASPSGLKRVTKNSPMN